jgi:hypothetical protein
MKSFVLAMIHLFDDLDDLYNAIIAGIFSIGIIGFAKPLISYLNDNAAYYFLLAVLSILGQTSMYFAKFRYPHLFGRHDKKVTIGTKILYYLIDCFLASLFGILASEYVVTWIFGGNSEKQTIISVILIGAFYETLLKKLLKKNNEISEDDDLNIKPKGKKQSIVGDGEEEGIDGTGTPVPIKLPPTPNE